MKIKKVILIILLILLIAAIVVGVLNLNQSVKVLGDDVNQINVESNINDGAFSTGDDQPIEQTKEILNDGDIVSLDENVFMTELNDVYLNYSEYEGKQIEYEGFVFNDPSSGALVVGREYYCCGYDAYIIGFECKYPEGIEKQIFEDDQWVKVTGIIHIQENQWKEKVPVIEVVEILEKEQEGLRVVTF